MKATHVLEQADFDALLELFSNDREEAARAYEKLRLGLVRYFHIKGCADADELADETMNRVALKAASFDPAMNVKPSAYIYGFASNIYLEYSRGPQKNAVAFDLERFEGRTEAASESELNELRYNCLHECLGKLSEDERYLIITYYSKERQEKIDLRKQLAGSLKCSTEVLHTRVFRIRSVLRKCVKRCIAEN